MKDEERVAWYFLRYKGEFAEGPVRVDTFFYVNARQRADEDNLRKLVLDALQRAGVVTNDRQVAGGFTWKEWASTGDERTVVRIGVPGDHAFADAELPPGLAEQLSADARGLQDDQAVHAIDLE